MIVLIVLAMVFGIGIGAAKALEPISIKKELNLESFKKWHDTRCAKFAEKLGEKISKIEEKQASHKNAYDNIVSRFETLIGRLEDKGYDVAQLKTDLVTLKDKIAKFKEDFKALTEKYEATKEKVCDDADAKIKSNLGETRTLIQAVQKDAKNIRTFYQNEIRSDIKAIKNQKPKTE